MSLGAEVADKEDEGQVADFEAAGDDAHICTLEVEASLQSGQNTYLAEQERQQVLQPAASDITATHLTRVYVSVTEVNIFSAPV